VNPGRQKNVSETFQTIWIVSFLFIKVQVKVLPFRQLFLAMVSKMLNQNAHPHAYKQQHTWHLSVMNIISLILAGWYNVSWKIKSLLDNKYFKLGTEFNCKKSELLSLKWNNRSPTSLVQLGRFFFFFIEPVKQLLYLGLSNER
jgi:hypothetical protein